MTAATSAIQRPFDAKLLVVDANGWMRHTKRARLLECLRAGDLVIANDAATLPASLHGRHERTGGEIEVRLAGRRSLSPLDVRFSAVVFGAGDFHTPTERRPSPPPLAPGDTLALGPLAAAIERLLDHPRLVDLRFRGPADVVWGGIASHGHPIQYAYLTAPLSLWDVWTPIAGRPVAFESPSAGFALDWSLVAAMRANGIELATITHAAGISSTGDEALDARLPLDEPYNIPAKTAIAIARALADRRRIVAVGTTVVRALEHAAARGAVHGGCGLATGRIGRTTRLRIVDAILTGVHEPGTSHYELLQAFADEASLSRANEMMTALGFRTHEFGDSMFIERRGVSIPRTSAEYRPDRAFGSAPASAAPAP
jgi:S-adenosylmethionine:tRNA ribosyltransferase-isomerase